MVSGDASGCASLRRRGTGESFRGHREIEKVPQGNRLPTTGESATVLSQGQH